LWESKLLSSAFRKLTALLVIERKFTNQPAGRGANMKFCPYGLAFLLVAFCEPAFGAELVGSVDKIVDGDTFWVCDQAVCQKIRLCGIDAPERGDPRGPAATHALKSLVDGRTVTCVPVGDGTVCDGRSKTWNGDRLVAQCSVGPSRFPHRLALALDAVVLSSATIVAAVVNSALWRFSLRDRPHARE
jgi:endonuclease YncB( thermonuclease family)